MQSLVKQCGICGGVKPLYDFYNHPTTKDGKSYCCASCQYNNTKKNYIKRTYKCTVEEYVERMNTSTCCKICGKETSLCYDHDHTTGEFRGVLCKPCNKALGALGDTAEGVLRAYEYLKGKDNDSTD